MRFSERFLSIEHALNHAIVRSVWLPGPMQRAFGQMRARLGAAAYQSVFPPTRTSPNRIIALTLGNGGTYLDIGADKGEMIATAWGRVGETGTIIAFEPRQNAAEFLRMMTSAYGFHNVHIVQSVVSDDVGEVTFFESSVHPASSSMQSGWIVGQGSARTYPVTTLDAWARKDGIERIDVVKIDVEGAELQVLRGGKALLLHTMPIMVIEISGQDARRAHFGYGLQELLDAFGAVGYSEFYCLRQDILASVADASDVLSSDSDLVAVNPTGNRARETIARLIARY